MGFRLTARRAIDLGAGADAGFAAEVLKACEATGVVSPNSLAGLPFRTGLKWEKRKDG